MDEQVMVVPLLEANSWIRKGDFHYFIQKIDSTHVSYTRHGGHLGVLYCTTGRVSFERIIEGGETVPSPSLGEQL